MCEEGYIDDITGEYSSAQLVVRRGQEFKVKLHLNKDYSITDPIKVWATIGMCIIEYRVKVRLCCFLALGSHILWQHWHIASSLCLQ